ncbi:MAG: hypothetical protein EP343_15530 [Deltaproteobacteria bacterium]|nr:MAG: hypothetical protein EP343_15530 [Deltaproteobacteria bacterium]
MEAQQQGRTVSLGQLYVSGILLSAGLTTIIALTAGGLAGFNTIGPTVPFAYPWRLKDPTFWSHATAWLGYAFHNIGAWLIIAAARRNRTRFSGNVRWFNVGMLSLHVVGFVLHWLQSRFFYDGLAQDVPEITALGSVALMLMIVLILETPRRGLIFGKKVKFHKRFLQICKEYHGYLFIWALIYTFWYHPMEGTMGHLIGFFYMFVLLGQSTLLFHRAHLNKWWTLSLEMLVLPHGVLVAIHQGKGLWPMFGFGFGAMFVLTQIHGLGFRTWTRRLWYLGFVVGTVAVYAALGRLSKIHEITRIPVLDYLVVGLLYVVFLGVYKLFGPKEPKPT